MIMIGYAPTAKLSTKWLQKIKNLVFAQNVSRKTLWLNICYKPWLTKTLKSKRSLRWTTTIEKMISKKVLIQLHQRWPSIDRGRAKEIIIHHKWAALTINKTTKGTLETLFLRIDLNQIIKILYKHIVRMWSNINTRESSSHQYSSKMKMINSYVRVITTSA